MSAVVYRRCLTIDAFYAIVEQGIVTNAAYAGSLCTPPSAGKLQITVRVVGEAR